MEKGGIAYDAEPESREFLKGGSGAGSTERPDLPELNPSEDPVIFMNTDIDYYTAKCPSFLGMGDEETTIVRIFGVTKHGNSVLAHVYNFRPFFYAKMPVGMELTASDMGEVIAKLEESSRDAKGTILEVEVVEKSSVMHYSEGHKKFLKIYVRFPSDVARLRLVFDQ